MTPHLTIFYELNPYDITNKSTFAGGSGELWKHRTLDRLPPDTAVDLRLINDASSFTRPLNHPLSKILILGEAALGKCMPDLKGSLNQHRGYVLTYKGRPAIATYAPIDCWQVYHKTAVVEADNDDDDDDDDDAVSDNKDVANTKRSNFLYWSFADFRKLISLPAFVPFAIPIAFNDIDVDLTSITNKLTNFRLAGGGDLVLDIETRMQDHSVDVVGLHFNRKPHVAVIYYHTDHRCDGRQLAAFWRELYLCFLSNQVTVIGHNLAFDLSVLCLTWKLPIPAKLYDTMLAMHRESPITEKSLSHAISFYLPAQRNHKGDICPNVSAVNHRQLITYNANDICTTADLAVAQRLKHAADDGLTKAVAAANAIQRTTLLMSLTGICIDETALEKGRQDQELAAEQYTRICRLLSGHPAFNPNSSQQKANFFYVQLQYPTVEKTKTGAPAAGAKALYKLATKQNNPLIPFIIAAVEAGKAASMMKFRRRESKV
jgi:hypothetical protein